MSRERLTRLKSILRLHEEKKEAFASVKLMREWVLEAEHIFQGAWAQLPEEVTNQEVGQRLDRFLEHLEHVLVGEEQTEEEKVCLEEFLRVLTCFRPGLVQCYDLKGFPRTNNDLERTIRALKMHYRRISGRKNWNSYLLRYGRCVASSRMVASSTRWRSSAPSSLLRRLGGIVAMRSATDTPKQPGAAPSLSISSSTIGVSRLIRTTMGASSWYGSIAPIVYKPAEID